MLSMDYIIGVDLSNLAVDTGALQQSANELIAQGDEANAIAVATDINANADEIADRLVAMGGQDALVQTGTDITNRSYDIVANYDPIAGDSSVQSKVARLQLETNAWQTQAWNALRAAPVATPPSTPPPAPPPSEGGGGPPAADDGGMAYGGGDGEPGGIDWGDGEQPPDRGGGGDDILDASSDGGQEIDWGDERVTPPSMEEAFEPEPFATEQSFDVPESFEEGSDPYADLLPSEEQEGQTEETEDRVSQYLIGVDVAGDVTVPKVGQTYTDAGTILAVQTSLKDKGFDPGPLDGVYGPKTKKAILAMQKAAGIPQTGVVDYGVLSALKVSAPTPDAASATPMTSSVPSKAGLWFGAPAAPGAPVQTELTFWKQPAWSGAPFSRWQGALGGVGLAALGYGVWMAVRK